MSEVSTRGRRTEGVGAKKPFEPQRFRPLFRTLFPMTPWENGNTFLENLWDSFGGMFVANPPPANPFSKPPTLVKKRKTKERKDRAISNYSGLFRVCFGVLGGVGVESGRGASVKEKNITTLANGLI